MKIAVKNFGPVSEANLEIKPLTFIMGRNNLGKSYLAQLVYILYTTFEPFTPLAGFRVSPPLMWMLHLDKDIVDPIKSKSQKEALDYATNLMIEKYRDWSKDFLKRRLEGGFGMYVRNLVSIGSSRAEIKTPLFRILIDTNDNLEVEWTNKPEVINRVKDAISGPVERIHRAVRRDDSRRGAFSMLEILDEKMRDLMFEGIKSREAIYVPAGRAGLLESFFTVQSALLSLGPLSFTREIKVPGLPPMASEFYIRLGELERRKGPMASIAEDFKKIIGGDIILKPAEEKAPRFLSMEYSFKYRGEESSIDIIHAASMIKELAPLYLFIKEVVKQNDFLIIEEPESHVHPGAQVRLVEILAKLTNKDVYILATTHSDLLLRKVALLVGQSLVKKEDPTSIDARMVAVYLLEETEGMYVSKPIPIPIDGILEKLPTFDEVIRELYEGEASMQSAQLERR